MAKNNTVKTYNSTILVVEPFKKKEIDKNWQFFSLCEVESVVGLVKYENTESSSIYSAISSNNAFTTDLFDTTGLNVYI